MAIANCHFAASRVPLKLEMSHPVPIRCRCAFTLLPSQVLAALPMVNYLTRNHAAQRGGGANSYLGKAPGKVAGKKTTLHWAGGHTRRHVRDSPGINSERNINKSPSLAIGVGISFPPPHNREILLFPWGVGSGTGLH